MSVHVFAQYLESTKWTSSEHYIFKLTKILKLPTDENEKNHQGETKHTFIGLILIPLKRSVSIIKHAWA